MISILTYPCPAWSGSVSYNQRAKVLSVYFSALGIILRDFNFQLNRKMLLRKASIDEIYFKRTLGLTFSIYYNLEPTGLAGKLIRRSYTNERHQGRAGFLDLIRSSIGKCSLLNIIKTYTELWSFEWTILNPLFFQRKTPRAVQK